MKKLKCFIARAIAKASTSHSNHSTCFLNLALKNPDNKRRSLLSTYNVASIPPRWTVPSVTIHNWPHGLGKEYLRPFELCGIVRSSSVNIILSVEGFPATTSSSQNLVSSNALSQAFDSKWKRALGKCGYPMGACL